MQMKSFPPFFYVFIATLSFTTLSCSSDDSPSKTLVDDDHVVVVHVPAGNPAPPLAPGQVSLVELSTGKVTKLADCDEGGGVTVRSGNDLFIIGGHSNGNSLTYVLDKFNLSTGTMERLADTQNETIPFFANPVTLHNDKFYFSGRDDQDWYICIVDKATFSVEDTIHLNNAAGVYDLKFFGEQLFVNLGEQVNVYANGSHKPSAVLKLNPGGGFDFIGDKSDRVVLPISRNVVAIDPGNLSLNVLTQNVKVPPFEMNPALAKEDNILYAIFDFHLGINPPVVQFTAVPLRFGKIDLATGETTWTGEEDTPRIMYKPEFIRYRKNQKQLIVGGWTSANGDTGLQVFSTDGKLIKDIPLNSLPVDVITD